MVGDLYELATGDMQGRLEKTSLFHSCTISSRRNHELERSLRKGTPRAGEERVEERESRTEKRERGKRNEELPLCSIRNYPLRPFL